MKMLKAWLQNFVEGHSTDLCSRFHGTLNSISLLLVGQVNSFKFWVEEAIKDTMMTKPNCKYGWPQQSNKTGFM